MLRIVVICTPGLPRIASEPMPLGAAVELTDALRERGYGFFVLYHFPNTHKGASL